MWTSQIWLEELFLPNDHKNSLLWPAQLAISILWAYKPECKDLHLQNPTSNFVCWKAAILMEENITTGTLILLKDFTYAHADEKITF